MGFNQAANRFVSLVDTKPELIVRGDRDGLSPSGSALLTLKRREFSKLFVEIGCGSGRHIIEQARRMPDALFVGFELRYKRVFRTAEKAEQLGLNNLLVVQMDASAIPQLFEPASLDGIFVLFPDPWDKRRWRKHRILSPEFLVKAHALLKPEAFLHYKTDHGEYFEATVKVLESLALFTTRRVSRNLHSGAESLNNIESEFEKLFKSKQLPVHLLEIVKPSVCNRIESVL